MLTQIGTIILGLGIMAAPALFGYGRGETTSAAANNDWIVGPLVVTFATIALWEATRAARWPNLVLGAWMIVAAWVLPYPMVPAALAALAGLAIALLSVRAGRIAHSFAGGWRALRHHDQPH